MVKQMRALFIKQGDAARQGVGDGAAPERLDALAEALRIWPTLEGVEPLYNKAFAKNRRSKWR